MDKGHYIFKARPNIPDAGYILQQFPPSLCVQNSYESILRHAFPAQLYSKDMEDTSASPAV